eukprot:CAMPEP_0172665340 /NCGR_PEP_ID=MMETSP1074-20121228/7194_1 /TAXON_ID=2916 /ORGANISM="Ceratium fusus, Strain PA161109" /LENGTH=76 /DNA_ID=CAMNT_0013481647 /DNA_START=20 /DNA_END=247 /DNA_ORIENTATION=+
MATYNSFHDEASGEMQMATPGVVPSVLGRHDSAVAVTAPPASSSGAASNGASIPACALQRAKRLKKSWQRQQERPS